MSIRWTGIQRVRVSDDDANGPQADYFDGHSVTNNLAVLTPYQITFRSFSPEVGEVLAGFASSPHGFIVKSINVQPAGAAAATVPETAVLMPAVPMLAVPMPAEPMLAQPMPNLPPGIRSRLAIPPAAPPAAPAGNPAGNPADESAGQGRIADGVERATVARHPGGRGREIVAQKVSHGFRQKHYEKSCSALCCWVWWARWCSCRS